jgi:7-carboxy-7-deazaguanine synthase
MRTDLDELNRFITECYGYVILKVVIFDELDYQWAVHLRRAYPYHEFFVSAGNDAGTTVGNPSRVDKRSDQQIAEGLIIKGRWLANRVMVDPYMRDVRVQMQQHVLYWGNRRGV